MIKDVKICGVSDSKTLKYILNHSYPPKFIGFIVNYEKSKRYVEFQKLKELINVNKKQINFTSVLVSPTNEILCNVIPYDPSFEIGELVVDIK